MFFSRNQGENYREQWSWLEALLPRLALFLPLSVSIPVTCQLQENNPSRSMAAKVFLKSNPKIWENEMIFALGCDTWTQILTKYVMAWSLDRITSLICCIPSWPPLGFVWTHEQKIRYTNAQNQSTTYDGVKLWTCCLPPSGSGACNSLPLHVGHQIQLMPKPQVGEGWGKTKQGTWNMIGSSSMSQKTHWKYLCSFHWFTKCTPLLVIYIPKPQIYIILNSMNMEITTLLWFSLIKFWFSQGTRCSASLASCGLRLNVIEAHVRAASQSSYYVSCHPLGRIGKQYEDKIAVALPPVPYPLEVGLRKRRAYWSDRACSPHGWPAWYLIWFISQKTDRMDQVTNPYLNWYVCSSWRDMCRPHTLG